MDDGLIRFRQAADRENRRRRMRRRYSSEFRQRAVAYWRRRCREEAVRTIAASLGVSATTLQRWTRASAGQPPFRPIEVIDSAPSAERRTTVVVQITPVGPRVEGLTVEAAARLLTLLQ